MRISCPGKRTPKHTKSGGLPAAALVAACAGALLAACGGGSDSVPAAPATAVSGSVHAAPVAGAGLSVKNAGGTTVAGPVTTSAEGAYAVTIPDSALSANLRFEAAGGTFVDEATGASTTAGRLAAYVPAGSVHAGSAVHLTPFSTIVHDLVVSGRPFPEARNVFNTAFGFADNTDVGPKNDNAVPGADNVARRLAAVRAAAFSQMTRDLGLGPDKQFPLIAAIAQDLSDNTLNGRSGADNVAILPGVPLPEDVQNRYERAFDRVFDNASVNRTGLTADQAGSLPFGKLALTNSDRVEYLPGAMAPAQGKTTFRVRINRRSDNAAVTGLVGSGSLTLFPWMHMATKSHSSPWDNAIVDNGDGTYTCTLYYLMSTAMNGIPMGYWHVDVVIGSPGSAETATFFPTVGMAMGPDTVRATLKGQNDNIAAPPTTEQRTYYLFKDGAMTYDNAAATHTLNVFLAAKESMTAFPAIAAGTVLHDAVGSPWTVNSVSVRASTDNVVWRDGTNVAGGHWTVPGLTGLVRGSTGHVSVEVVVEGEQKTTNGAAPSGANGWADLTVSAP